MSAMAHKKVKKPVTRHSVASSFNTAQDWPAIGTELQVELLGDLCALLLPLGEYRRKCLLLPKRTHRRKATVSNDAAPEKPNSVKKLEMYCLVGLNACTRALEGTIKSASESPANAIRVLFICKDDLSSSMLYDHYPTLCHLSRDVGVDVRLVALPKGAQSDLGYALDLPRVGCIALSMCSETESIIAKVVDQVNPTVSSLLQGGNYKNLLIKTHVSTISGKQDRKIKI